MRLLLLGCTGFVGKELVPALLKEGHEICIISRKNINNLKINVPLKKFKFLNKNFMKFSPEMLRRNLRNLGVKFLKKFLRGGREFLIF